MNRILTILTLVAAILIGAMPTDAQTAKRKARTSATHTAKKAATKPAGALAVVALGNGGKLYLVKGGSVKVTPANWGQDGTYVESNGAYIMNWGSGTYGDNKISVIYGDTMYTIIASDYAESEFWDYYWDHDSKLSLATSFDAATQTLTLKTTEGNKKVKLSSIPTSDRMSVSWF